MRQKANAKLATRNTNHQLTANFRSDGECEHSQNAKPGLRGPGFCFLSDFVFQTAQFRRSGLHLAGFLVDDVLAHDRVILAELDALLGVVLVLLGEVAVIAGFALELDNLASFFRLGHDGASFCVFTPAQPVADRNDIRNPANRAGDFSHAFPNTKSTTQQPRTCGPSPRQWFSISSLSQPAS